MRRTNFHSPPFLPPAYCYPACCRREAGVLITQEVGSLLPVRMGTPGMLQRVGSTPSLSLWGPGPFLVVSSHRCRSALLIIIRCALRSGGSHPSQDGVGSGLSHCASRFGVRLGFVGGGTSLAGAVQLSRRLLWLRERLRLPEPRSRTDNTFGDSARLARFEPGTR